MAFANPFRKRRCPACGNEFYPGNCAIVSTVSSGKELQKARPGFLYRFWLTPTNGPVFAKELACRQCPTCKIALPDNIESAESYTIAIVGDGSSGKSHFIASCIHELKTMAAQQIIGCSSVIAQGDSEAVYSKNYHQPVYIHHQQIQVTQPKRTTINPLIYELVFSGQSRLKPARSVNLLFYDASGEDIADRERMVQYSSYILNASAIIFLADPLTMPGIVSGLPDHLRPKVLRESSTSDVLNRVIRTFQRSQRIAPGGKIKIPIAITVPKSDVLKYITKYDVPSPSFLNPATYTNALNTWQFNTTSDEVRNLLLRAGDNVLVHCSRWFENTAFFAVSATGWAPDDKGKFPAIETLRCLDPLLWVLWKLGVVQVS